MEGTIWVADTLMLIASRWTCSVLQYYLVPLPGNHLHFLSQLRSLPLS